MVRRLLKDGSFQTYAATVKPGSTTLEKKDGTLNQLHGMLGFIDTIDLYNREHATGAKDSDPLSKKELMYQRFLIYRNFFAAETPVVLCEGETDNVYLTHAIRSLAADFAELASKGPDGKIHINVRLYKYRRSSTARILGGEMWGEMWGPEAVKKSTRGLHGTIAEWTKVRTLQG